MGRLNKERTLDNFSQYFMLQNFRKRKYTIIKDKIQKVINDSFENYYPLLLELSS